jgi:hypothetical protein
VCQQISLSRPPCIEVELGFDKTILELLVLTLFKIIIDMSLSSIVMFNCFIVNYTKTSKITLVYIFFHTEGITTECDINNLLAFLSGAILDEYRLLTPL